MPPKKKKRKAPGAKGGARKKKAAARARAKPKARARPPAAGEGEGAEEAWGTTEAGAELAGRVRPDAEVLRGVERLGASMRAVGAPERKGLADVRLPCACREVVDSGRADVMDAIVELAYGVARSILAGEGYGLRVPSRTSQNQLYVPELDRLVLRDAASLRKFGNRNETRKVVVMTKVLELVHQLCAKDITATKRDVFYSDVKLFRKQEESDHALEDVACMLGFTRCSLHVVASEKGLVVGRVRYREAGDLIDCTRMGIGGKAIPSNVSKCEGFESDAKFILLVEKDAAFQRLSEDRFYNRFPCIIVTGKGQPDVATRQFLRKMKEALNVPVLGLVDSDPYGLKILSVYMSGSKNMSFDSSNLTTPDIKWLGVRPSDLDRFHLPAQCRLAMTDKDIATGKKLLEEDFIKQNPAWVAELELMLAKREKAEIQALSSFGFQYLTEVYLPLKLQECDWI